MGYRCSETEHEYWMSYHQGWADAMSGKQPVADQCACPVAYERGYCEAPAVVPPAPIVR